jgi:hypothetical protein
MREQKLKPESSGSGRTLGRPSEAAQSLLTKRQELMTFPNNGAAAPLFTKPMLLVEKLAGAMLGGIGVTALVGTLFVCACMLLTGPGFVTELLPK